MSTTAASPAPPIALKGATFRELPIAWLTPSPLNPRKTFEPVRLAELATSIAIDGVIEPLVVRPLQFTTDAFEIVAGERRFRASQTAGLTVLPCMVRDLTDAQVIEHGLVENHQRADVHPLEEAEGIQQLMEIDPAYTVQAVAARVGVSLSWVYGRLKLLTLPDATKAVYRANAITADHADQLTRVPAQHQAAALRACFSDLLFVPDRDFDGPSNIDEAIASGRADLLAPCVRSGAELRRWIARHTTVDIADPATQAALPEVALAIEDAAAEGRRVLQVSVQEYPVLSPAEAKDLGVVRWGRWVEILDVDPEGPKPKVLAHQTLDRCEAMESAVVAHPADAPARRLTICYKRGCPVHRPSQVIDAAPPTDPVAAARALQEEQARIDAQEKARQRLELWHDVQRPKYFAALAKRVRTTKVTPDLVRSLVGRNPIELVYQNFGLELTPATAVTVLVLALCCPATAWHMAPDAEMLVAFGKAFGLTPAQWQRSKSSTVKPSTPKKTAARKAAKPVPAKASKKKGGR